MILYHMKAFKGEEMSSQYDTHLEGEGNIDKSQDGVSTSTGEDQMYNLDVTEVYLRVLIENYIRTYLFLPQF